MLTLFQYHKQGLGYCKKMVQIVKKAHCKQDYFKYRNKKKESWKF